MKILSISVKKFFWSKIEFATNNFAILYAKHLKLLFNT